MDKLTFFDGKKAITLSGDEGWTIYGKEGEGLDADKLYSTVAWMYRCVEMTGNSVMSMPFVIKRGDDEVFAFDGVTPEYNPPADIGWVVNLPVMLKKVEVATTLGGRAYFERRVNISRRRAVGYDWFIPWSIIPAFNEVPNTFGTKVSNDKVYGDLLGFWRHFPGTNMQPIWLEIEDMVWFWPPDYAVEIGPAVNYPARAVLANAQIVANLDIFLRGYFERGLIKATLLKYKDQLQPSERERVKEWWKRATAGLKNAFGTEVVRGDFEAMTIGDGVKELRDNVLSRDEKTDIAIGLGIPLSKVNSMVSTDSNRDADDVQYIEELIIPKVNWIYDTVNEQMLEPLGYRIMAQPQQLRVMQTDENERSQSFLNLRNGGLSIEASTAILGMTIPDDVPLRDEPPEPPATQNERRRDMEDEDEDEEPATRAVAISELDIIAILDKRDEVERFKRWLGKRETFDVSQYATNILTAHEKTHIAINYIRQTQDMTAQKALEDDIEDYTERLAEMVLQMADNGLSRDDMVQQMAAMVTSSIEGQFRTGADIPPDADLTETEADELSRIVNINIESIGGFVDASLEAFQKGALFDTLKQESSSIAARVLMWGNALREALNVGKIFNRNQEKRFQWRLGATEEHCTDCLSQHNKIRTSSEWAELAGVLIYPQSRALECKGYNCDCALYQVD